MTVVDSSLVHHRIIAKIFNDGEGGGGCGGGGGSMVMKFCTHRVK